MTSIQLLTSDELILVTGVARRTHNRWVGSGYNPPIRRGGGRGKTSKFDKANCVWAMALDELFNLWPHADVSVYLDEVNDPPPLEGPPYSLKDGNIILDYLREQDSKSWVSFDVAVFIFCGNKGVIDNPSPERFVEVLITPMENATTYLANYIDVAQPAFSTSVGGQLIKSVSIINLNRLSKQVEYKAKQLRH